MSDVNPPSISDDPARTARVDPLPIDQTAAVCSSIVDNVSTVIIGNDRTIEHVVTAMFARGHVLLDDVPGVGKTMLAKSIARSIDCSFGRIQFTPDLLPSDITGVNVFNQKTREFEFQAGPIFANVVLGDEINRAPAKTQSALLEAMEEGTVSVDGETRRLPHPFTVIATQNSVEPDRTYELPFAEIDRFMKRLSLGYPAEADEVAMLERTVGHHPIESLEAVTDLDTVTRARQTVAEVTTSEAVRRYVTRLVRYTRKKSTLGVSPRGGIALLRASQARAVLDGRDYVIPDDVQVEAHAVLSHRVRTADREEEPDEDPLIEAALDHVPVE